MKSSMPTCMLVTIFAAICTVRSMVSRDIAQILANADRAHQLEDYGRYPQNGPPSLDDIQDFKTSLKALGDLDNAIPTDDSAETALYDPNATEKLGPVVRRGPLYIPDSVPKQLDKPKSPAYLKGVKKIHVFPFSFACNRRSGCRNRFYKRSNGEAPLDTKRGLLCNRGGCRSKRRNKKGIVIPLNDPDRKLSAVGDTKYTEEKYERMCSFWRCIDPGLNIRRRIVCSSLGCPTQSQLKLSRRKRDGEHDDGVILFGCNPNFCYGFDMSDKGRTRRDKVPGLGKGVYVIDLVYQKKQNCDGGNCYKWAGFHRKEPDQQQGQCSKDIKCGSYKNRIKGGAKPGTTVVNIDSGQMALSWSCTKNSRCNGLMQKQPQNRYSTGVQVTKFKGYSYVLPGYYSLFSLDLVCKCNSSAECQCCGTRTYSNSNPRRFLESDEYVTQATEDGMHEVDEDNGVPPDEDEYTQTADYYPAYKTEDKSLRDVLGEFGQSSDNVNLDLNFEDNFMQMTPGEFDQSNDKYIPQIKLPAGKQSTHPQWLDGNSGGYGVSLTRRQGCNFGQNCYWLP